MTKETPQDKINARRDAALERLKARRAVDAPAGSSMNTFTPEQEARPFRDAVWFGVKFALIVNGATHFALSLWRALT